MRAIAVIPALALFWALLMPLAARGQDDDSPMAARLSAERVGDITPGLYSVGDTDSFTLEAYGDRMLLRLSDSPEKFVLTVDRASLGAKVLKYDTGATALRVSVWGGLTLYTQADPNGLPATRQGDVPIEPALSVGSADLAAALTDEASHLSYVQGVGLRFSVDTPPADDAARAGAFTALTNAGLGVERFLAAPGAKKALAKLDSVKLAEAPRPQVQVAGKSLTVSYAPGQGLAGCPSSHAVAHGLGKLLAIATEE